MDLDPLYRQVLPRLTNTGATDQAVGVLDVQSIDIGHRHFDVPEGIAYDVSLVNTGEAILLSGRATAALGTSCDRCLEPTQLSITGEVQGYFLFDPSSIKSGESLEEYEAVDSDGRVDLAPPILAAIVFELPTVTLCNPDCVGVTAPEDTDTVDDVQDEDEFDAEPPSPFAALKDFKFDE